MNTSGVIFVGEILNLDDALRSHLQWKIRLRTSIIARRADMRASDVRGDDACELGRWLYGEGRRSHAGSAPFEELRRTHAAFHRAAADVVALMEAGRFDDAAAAIDEQGPYAEATANVRATILQLQRALVVS